MKKIVVMVMLLLGSALLFANGAEAAPAWYTCSISEAGNSLGNTFVTCTDVGATFTNRVFFLVGTQVQINQALAAGLTAWSTGGHVKIYADNTTFDGVPAFALSCAP